MIAHAPFPGRALESEIPMTPTPSRPRHVRRLPAMLIVTLFAAATASANDWYRWRGPEQNE